MPAMAQTSRTPHKYLVSTCHRPASAAGMGLGIWPFSRKCSMSLISRRLRALLLSSWYDLQRCSKCSTVRPLELDSSSPCNMPLMMASRFPLFARQCMATRLDGFVSRPRDHGKMWSTCGGRGGRGLEGSQLRARYTCCDAVTWGEQLPVKSHNVPYCGTYVPRMHCAYCHAIITRHLHTCSTDR
jgi:hypothetical protein